MEARARTGIVGVLDQLLVCIKEIGVVCLLKKAGKSAHELYRRVGEGMGNMERAGASVSVRVDLYNPTLV